MAKKSTLYYIYSDLVNAVKNIIDSKYIFLGDRPNVNNEATPMSKFVVISLPLRIDDRVIGNRKISLETEGVLHLFTLARANNTLNLNDTGEFIDKAMSLFPISGDYCVATNPSVVLSGADNLGYQAVTIRFDLRSRWGVFENQK